MLEVELLTYHFSDKFGALMVIAHRPGVFIWPERARALQ